MNPGVPRPVKAICVTPLNRWWGDPLKIDFYRMLDLGAVFTIWRSDTPLRYVHGLISLFQQGDSNFRRTRYTTVIEPTLKRFDLRSN